MSETEAFVILSAMDNVGPAKIRLLIKHFGSAIAALKASSKEIASIAGCEKIAQRWNEWPLAQGWKKDLQLAASSNVAILPFTHPQFPKRLLTIDDAPALLYVKGELKPEDQRCIAIVGTRNASIYGNEMAETIAADLVARGFTIISGLARGIDTAAHAGALRNRGRTIAVIGSGLAHIYPPENLKLSEAIINQGALISEFAMTAPPDRKNFPQRNRIVSGMTLGTLLIEAPVASGAMITMRQAEAQNRKLFALPGRADSNSFGGNHWLIKNSKAHLIENGEDVARFFPDDSFLPVHPHIAKHIVHLDQEEQCFLNHMPEQETSIDELVAITAFPINQVHRILLGLILKKEIKEFPGKMYKKIKIRP